MGAAEPSRLIEGRHKRRRNERAHTGGGGQPLHHRVGGRGRDDRGIGDGQVLGQLRPHGEQGPERRRQLGRERELLHVGAEPVGVARPDAQALTAHQRAHEGDGPAAGPHQQVPHAELPAHLALRRGHPVRRTIGLDPARLGQHPRVAPIRLHASAPLRIHGRVIRIRHDDLMPAGLERLRHPFAFGRRFEQDARPGPWLKHRRETVPRALDPPLDHFAVRRQDTNLTFPLVNVDANMLHGWPLSLRVERVCGLWSGDATT